MLRNALDAYGDEDTSLSKWNARKKQAVAEGKWTWKDSVVNANAAIKSRFDKEEVQTTVKARFGDVTAAMEEEMSSTIHVDQHGGQLLGLNDRHEGQCCWRHHAFKHGIKDDYDSPSCATPVALTVTEVGSTRRPKLSQRTIWLGPYVVCRNLEAKLGIAPTTLSNPKTCSVHDTPVQLCTTCFLQQRQPVSPFRLYSALATGVESGSNSLRIEAEATEEEEYLIFRDDDEEFCPAVNIWGVFTLTIPSKRKVKGKVILPDPLSSVLYIKVTTICRDAVGEAWIFGYVLAHRKRSLARNDEDEHEVVPDKDRGLCLHYSAKSWALHRSTIAPGMFSIGNITQRMEMKVTRLVSRRQAKEAMDFREICFVDQVIHPK
ncbi:hypothetical protein AM588_10001846 [Phytophthora nicotianae]|uniref:Uncharacterized protein n=1 Tax=Phytophthora nicotianae TaxID=4792 RepID=A0A0W8CWK9_PHYNI|nr:hypothetical protein AM588_10001846 [Phytophthora nicotianae]